MIIIFGVVLFLPWPLALGAIIISTIMIKPIYGTLAAALLFDWAYGKNGHLMIGLLTMVGVLIVVFISRQFIRFDRLKNDY
ncbi:MAG: hypothetical protein AAB677_00840 [Patescibacteria group bacterium]